MLKITRSYKLHIAHRNKSLEGLKQFNFHGHTYTCNITFKVDENDLDESGSFMPIEGFDKLLTPVIESYNYQLIVSAEETLHVGGPVTVTQYQPTIEGLCQSIYDAVKQTPIGTSLHTVSLSIPGLLKVLYKPEKVSELNTGL